MAQTKADKRAVYSAGTKVHLKVAHWAEMKDAHSAEIKVSHLADSTACYSMAA